MPDEGRLTGTTYSANADDADRRVANPAVEPGLVIIAAGEFLIVGGLVLPMDGDWRWRGGWTNRRLG